MNIVAFGASISKTSINKAFAHFVASSFEGHDLNLLDLNSFALPAFSVDIEKEPQYVAVVQDFISTVQIADLLVISMAEHNRSMTAAFKSLIDWSSECNMTF
jgi:NAD(P)H-dependent FMN reductase